MGEEMQRTWSALRSQSEILPPFIFRLVLVLVLALALALVIQLSRRSSQPAGGGLPSYFWMAAQLPHFLALRIHSFHCFPPPPPPPSFQPC